MTAAQMKREAIGLQRRIAELERDRTLEVGSGMTPVLEQEIERLEAQLARLERQLAA